MLIPRTWFKVEECRLEYPPHLSYLCVTWRLGAWPAYILYQYIIFSQDSNTSYRFLSSFVGGLELLQWRWNMIDSEMEKKELGKAPSCTHNKRSLVRTSQVCHRRLAVCERSQQVKEYKHTHTHTNTHTHARAPARTHTHTHLHDGSKFSKSRN